MESNAPARRLQNCRRRRSAVAQRSRWLRAPAREGAHGSVLRDAIHTASPSIGHVQGAGGILRHAAQYGRAPEAGRRAVGCISVLNLGPTQSLHRQHYSRIRRRYRCSARSPTSRHTRRSLEQEWALAYGAFYGCGAFGVATFIREPFGRLLATIKPIPHRCAKTTISRRRALVPALSRPLARHGATRARAEGGKGRRDPHLH